MKDTVSNWLCPNWAEVVSAIGTLVLAIAAIVALWNWKRTLKNQRADECNAAARNLEAAFGRAIAVRKERDNKNDSSVSAIQELWQDWRRFDQSFIAARRYFKQGLAPDLPRRVADKIDDFRRLHDDRWNTAASDKAENLKKEVAALLVPVYRL